MSARTPIVWLRLREWHHSFFRCTVPMGSTGFMGVSDLIYWVCKGVDGRWYCEDNCGGVFGDYDNDNAARAAVERRIGL